MPRPGNVTDALHQLSDALAEKPVWLILLSRQGEVVGKYGDFKFAFPPLTDTQVSDATMTHALQEIDMLDRTHHGTFQSSIHFGGDGTFIIVHLVDQYLLGISYYSIGINSLDAVVESVFANWHHILSPLLWPIDE